MPLLSHIKKKRDKFVPQKWSLWHHHKRRGIGMASKVRALKRFILLKQVDPKTYTIPWMEQCGGVARHDELVERWEKAAIAPAMLAPTLELFDICYGARLDHGCYSLDLMLFLRKRRRHVALVRDRSLMSCWSVVVATALALSELQVARTMKMGMRLW